MTSLVAASVVAGAASPTPEIVRAAAAAAPDAPTPCADWDLRALVRHLLYWSPLLAAAGRREAAVPRAASEGDVDLDGWPAALVAAQQDVVAAWSPPAAWAGTTRLIGPDPLPAAMIGGMVVGELVVHGWDLGRAAGMQPRWPEDVLAAAYEAVQGMAEQGRGMGVFGPEVTVPATATVLDRLLALSGRDPSWTP